MRTIFAILLLPALAVAQDTKAVQLKAVLIVPKTLVAGQDFYLDGSQSTGDIEHYIFEVEGADGTEAPIIATGDRTKPRVPSLSGKWTVSLRVVTEDGRVSKAKEVCIIPGSGGSCPEPTPPDNKPKPDDGIKPTPIPPKPEPQPQPDVVPVGEFGIAPKIHAAGMKVQSANRAAEAKALADVCDVYAAQIAAGTLKDPQALVTGFAAEFKKYPAWASAVPEIGKAIADTVKTNPKRLKVNGTLSFTMDDPDGWRQLCKEVGVGVRAVK